KIPPKTKNCFTVPADWIKQIDPRLKQRIITETAEQLKKKFAEKRKKEVEKLNERLEKEKITKKQYKEKVWQFDNVMENNIQNTTAKRIEKAHSYSFNLQNYRSSLRDEQIKKWQNAFCDIKIKNGSNIEARYEELLKADDKTALRILASFNSESGLEMDIAREYLSKLEIKNKKLEELEEILKEAQKFPFENLSNLLKVKSEKIKKENGKKYKQITIKLYGRGVILRQEILGEEIKTDGQYKVSTGDFIMSKIDARSGAFGIVPENLDSAIVTSSFPYFEINTDLVKQEFLIAIITKPNFYNQINNMVAGATGRRSVETDDFLSLKIPLPPLEVQQEIVEKIERQKGIIEGAEKISSGLAVDFDVFKNFNKKYISEFAELNPRKNITGLKDNDKVSFVSMEAVSDELGKIINVVEKELQEVKKGYTYFKNDDVVFAKITPCMENGKSALVANLKNGVGFGSTEFHVIRAEKSKALPKYIYYLVRTKYFRDCAKEKMTGASGHKRVPEEFMTNFKYPVPPLETQKQIVARLDKEMETLEKVRELKKQAEDRINKILEEVWGG
ncbi:MAG: restriction endonuclease subunit S, partial [Patescibacteria group bacterium]|nr:restriction endonuclease subunit S [Patescibacteria group bacterium]